MNFWVIYEKTGTGYSAWCPDVLGCVSTGKTLEDAQVNMREALSGHLSTMREFGETLPVPSTVAACMSITEEEINEPTTPVAQEHESSVRAA